MIGGKGGSGTRVFAEIVSELDFYKGPCNASNDVIIWVDFIHKYSIPHLDKWFEGNFFDDNLYLKMTKEFEPLLKKYLKYVRIYKDGQWAALVVSRIGLRPFRKTAVLTHNDHKFI